MCLVLYFVHDLAVIGGILTAAGVIIVGLPALRLFLVRQHTIDPLGLRLLHIYDEMIGLVTRK
jgi:hypothetical protein